MYTSSIRVEPSIETVCGRYLYMWHCKPILSNPLSSSPPCRHAVPIQGLRQLEQNPDLVDDTLLLVTRALAYCPRIVLSPPATALAPLLNMAMLGVLMQVGQGGWRWEGRGVGRVEGRGQMSGIEERYGKGINGEQNMHELAAPCCHLLLFSAAPITFTTCIVSEATSLRPALHSPHFPSLPYLALKWHLLRPPPPTSAPPFPLHP